MGIILIHSHRMAIVVLAIVISLIWPSKGKEQCPWLNSQVVHVLKILVAHQHATAQRLKIPALGYRYLAKQRRPRAGPWESRDRSTEGPSPQQRFDKQHIEGVNSVASEGCPLSSKFVFSEVIEIMAFSKRNREWQRTLAFFNVSEKAWRVWSFERFQRNSWGG